MTTAAETLAVLLDYQTRHPHQGRADEVSDGPAETTATSRDPDGLAAENARERQGRWFEC